MTTQNYAKHTQLVPLFHFILMPVLLLTLIGAAVNLYQSWDDHERIYSASLILVLVICMIILSFLARTFALKAQDRAIRAEENLRFFVLTGKLLDSRLGIRQVIALRFAPDAELVALAKKAADESLASDAIKRAIQQWRPDTYRV
ncbi:MAG TPA: DUF6526 family protein [Bryobacteraceae bacterium]|jgi:hypothetical protein|nr:DUF6526 family protein [Bryobacteraceae bacterium]